MRYHQTKRAEEHRHFMVDTLAPPFRPPGHPHTHFSSTHWSQRVSIYLIVLSAQAIGHLCGECEILAADQPDPNQSYFTTQSLV